MFKVCIHHPLNPEESKKCIGRKTHNREDISELDIPFSGDLRKFDYALKSLGGVGVISFEDGRAVYERTKRKQEEMANAINQKIWLAATETPLSDLGGRSVRRDPIDLNDPRIAEINIKYRD